jgi:hypothetical protein
MFISDQNGIFDQYSFNLQLSMYKMSVCLGGMGEF